MPTSTRHCGNLLQHARAPVCSSQGHVPRSELSIAANHHSISQYSLQSGDSRKALVRNGRAESAGRIVAGCYHLSEPCWSVGWGGGGMSHRGTSAPVCSLCRATASTAFRRAGLCSRSTSELWMCVLCRTGRTGSHHNYPSRWEGHLSLCATCGMTGALWRLILYMPLAPTGINKEDYSLGLCRWFLWEGLEVIYQLSWFNQRLPNCICNGLYSLWN